MSWEEAVDRIRRGFANPDVEQVTDTADTMTFYSKKRGTYQLKNTADGLKMTILTKPSKSSKKEYGLFLRRTVESPLVGSLRLLMADTTM